MQHIGLKESKPVGFIKLSKSLCLSYVDYPLSKAAWKPSCSELWAGCLGSFTAAGPVLFGKEISISILKYKMQTVSLYAIQKEKRRSRLCCQDGIHNSKLCGEEKMEESVEGFISE